MHCVFFPFVLVLVLVSGCGQVQEPPKPKSEVPSVRAASPDLADFINK